MLYLPLKHNLFIIIFFIVLHPPSRMTKALQIPLILHIFVLLELIQVHLIAILLILIEREVLIPCPTAILIFFQLQASDRFLSFLIFQEFGLLGFAISI
jgi:hypothetical protein